MTEERYQVERTSAGLQYVIPGTERAPAGKPPVRYARDGDQLVIPGAERIGVAGLLDRLAGRPLRPRVGQRGHQTTPLFGRRE